MNRLHRADGPRSYRLMAVEMLGEQWIGQTAGGNSLLDDIAAYRSAICKPLYAVFVHPVTDSRAAQEKGV